MATRHKLKSSTSTKANRGIQNAEAPVEKASKPCPVPKYPFNSENDEREPMPDLEGAWETEYPRTSNVSSSVSSSSTSTDGLFTIFFKSGVRHSPPTKAEIVRWRLWLTEHGVPDEEVKALTYGEAYVRMKRLWLREHEKEEIESMIAHLSQRLGKRTGQAADSVGGKQGQNQNAAQKRNVIAGEALALGLLAEHPDWSDIQIARAVGVSRTTLYTWPKYMKAKDILRQAKKDQRKGFKNTETGHIEAWEPDTLADTSDS